MSNEPENKPAAPTPALRVTQFVDPLQAKSDLAYSLADLSSAMQTQPGLHLDYAINLAKASKQLNDLKITLEAAESKVYRRIRDDYVTAGTKITEAALEKEVAAHPTIRGIKRAINEAKQVEAIAKGVVEAFGQRKDMLVQAGARDRAELEGEIRIQVAGGNADAIKAGAQQMLARRQELLNKSNN